MKTILVPVDFSKHSENAFQLACFLASAKGMSIKLIHIIEDPHLTFNVALGKQYFDQLTEITLEHLGKLSKKAKEKNIPIEYGVEKSTKGIAKDLIRHKEADLIVMGKVGINHEESFLLGSTATRVIRSSSVPVITVGELNPDYKVKKIVFASDFKEAMIAPILDRVIRLGELLMAEVHLVKIETDKDIVTPYEQDKFELSLKKFDLKGLKVMLHADRIEEEGIINYANKMDADLIVLCTHGRKGIVNLLKGSIAETVSLLTDIPVLTYNIGAEHIDRMLQPISREGRVKSANKSTKGKTN